MDLPQAIQTCFNKYATFTGRAARSEYWFWVLFTTISSIVLSLLDGILFGQQQSVLYGIFVLGTLLPSLSVAARRLHDLDRSGWWLLLILIPLIGMIIIIIWMCTKGTSGDNSFGSDPLVNAPSL